MIARMDLEISENHVVQPQSNIHPLIIRQLNSWIDIGRISQISTPVIQTYKKNSSHQKEEGFQK